MAFPEFSVCVAYWYNRVTENHWNQLLRVFRSKACCRILLKSAVKIEAFVPKIDKSRSLLQKTLLFAAPDPHLQFFKFFFLANVFLIGGHFPLPRKSFFTCRHDRSFKRYRSYFIVIFLEKVSNAPLEDIRVFKKLWPCNANGKNVVEQEDGAVTLLGKIFF